MANETESRSGRIGLLVTVAVLTLMVFLFFIGSERKIFSRKYEYKVRMENVSGLAEGNPVQLAGVTIGSVKDIYLPRNPTDQRVDITITVDRKFADRIRQDSRARIRKLGLIASDSYIDITPGSPEEPALPPGSVIPAARATDVDKLIASGEDLVDNFVQISYSLKNVLQRIDRGEGLIGELTTEPATKQRITDTLMTTINHANSVLRQIESGEGVVGKLVYDKDYADQLTGSLGSAAHSLQVVSGSLEESFASGKGALPALLSDPEGKAKVDQLLDQLATTSANLATFSKNLSEGEGVVPRLMTDKSYADDTLEEFKSLVTRLDATARMLQEGKGTAGRLIADPSIYESINDILIGINESRMLRWLIRNRQKAGIEQRYETETSTPQPEAPVETPPASEETPPVETPQSESPPAASGAEKSPSGETTAPGAEAATAGEGDVSEEAAPLEPGAVPNTEDPKAAPPAQTASSDTAGQAAEQPAPNEPTPPAPDQKKTDEKAESPPDAPAEPPPANGPGQVA